MPLQATAGAATYDAFGGGVTVANYIEDVFQTWLYTGNGSSQTITNGVDLSGKGGLVWCKNRAATDGAGNTANHALMDSATGGRLRSNTTGALLGSNVTLLSTGFSVTGTELNYSGDNLVSWTFRKQPKFFDVVTYTGTGSAQTIAHNLGSVPGCIIVKRTDTTSPWAVAHRGTSNYSSGTDGLNLNTTDAVYSGTVGGWWNSTGPTSTQFSVGTYSETNASGGTYVAYLFAHDAGGFGASGTDNVISCGSFTLSSGNATVNLGWEPQWVIAKRTDTASDWWMADVMRGMPVSTGSNTRLLANTSGAEGDLSAILPNATGFTTDPAAFGASSGSWIYIAIRRGPMRTPTPGTSVFSPQAYSGLVPGSGNVTRTSGFPIDFIWARLRNGTVSFGVGNSPTGVLTRLTGGLWTGSTTAATPIMATLSTDPETTQNTGIFGASNTGFVTTGNTGGLAVDTGSGEIYVAECFRRAPGFFDVVCYTGTGSATTVTHNLGVVPEMVIAKTRSLADSWYVYTASVGNQRTLYLDASNPQSNTNVSYWNNTTPTVSVFTVGAPGGAGSANISGETYVAYLFATVAGVSKVGSYTGTGTTLQIDCGFTAGARFVLIKRTDSTGDWYVWDSARGIVAGSDPYLTLNTTAAEVTTTDWVDTYSAGFELSNAGGNNVNINGATYIFLSVA